MTDFNIEKSNINFLSDTPLVVILLCTYNGERFLAEQLDSLESQTYQNWVLIVSDDGSTDGTLEILQKYQSKWLAGKLTIRNGPQKGFCQNFLSLACDSEIKADYYAFCDQDDVWLPNKIMVAVSHIESITTKSSAYVYCSRTYYVNEVLKTVGLSTLFLRPTSFKNSLTQSIAGGNTMVFNAAAKMLLETIGSVNVGSHDWWIYQLVSGVGGVIYYDIKPQLLYRQHSAMLVGRNNSFFARTLRLYKLMRGYYRNWNDQNITALLKIDKLLTKENRKILHVVAKKKNAGLVDRLHLVMRCKLYRQTRFTNFILQASIIFNKF